MSHELYDMNSLYRKGKNGKTQKRKETKLLETCVRKIQIFLHKMTFIHNDVLVGDLLRVSLFDFIAFSNKDF